MTAPNEDLPFMAVAHEVGSTAKASTNGVAVSLIPQTNASVPRYGIAYCTSGGTANSGASGVSLTKRNGTSLSGDGGASIAHHSGNAQCGHHGVAFSVNPGHEKLGAVSGYNCATLMICWVKDEQTYSKVARVGDCVDGVQISPGKWYSLDWQSGSYCWIETSV